MKEIIILILHADSLDNYELLLTDFKKERVLKSLFFNSILNLFLCMFLKYLLS